MTKFPNVRDLNVDCSKVFDHLGYASARVELDGSHALGPGRTMSIQITRAVYETNRAITSTGF